MKDNRDQAVALMKKTEKRLLRNPAQANKYCEQFDDFVKRGVLTLITEEEMNNYNGPVLLITKY